jgi:hypothetical protein
MMFLSGSAAFVCVQTQGERFEVGEMTFVTTESSLALKIVASGVPHGMDRFVAKGMTTFLNINGDGDFVVTRAWMKMGVRPAVVSGGTVTFVNCVLSLSGSDRVIFEDCESASDDEPSPAIALLVLGDCSTADLESPWSTTAGTYLVIGGVALAGVVIGVGLFVGLYCSARAVSRWNMRRRDRVLE